MPLIILPRKPMKAKFAVIGVVIGAGCALLLPELGLGVEIPAGIMVLGLCIGAFIDKWTS